MLLARAVYVEDWGVTGSHRESRGVTFTRRTAVSPYRGEAEAERIIHHSNCRKQQKNIIRHQGPCRLHLEFLNFPQ